MVRPVASPTGRLCARCGESKPLSMFHRAPRMRDGLQSWCKACASASTQAWRARNREAINAGRRAEYVAAPHPVRVCERCGNGYTAWVSFQRFCSPKCKDYEVRHSRARSANQRLRARVIARWGTICYLCGSAVREPSGTAKPGSLSIDHVMPVSADGPNSIENLRVTHLGCNVEKGDRLPSWWELRAASNA